MNDKDPGSSNLNSSNPGSNNSNSTMGKTDNDVLERDKIIKKKNSWLKWGIPAACLCLAIGVLFETKAVGTKGKDPDILEDTSTLEAMDALDKPDAVEDVGKLEDLDPLEDAGKPDEPDTVEDVGKLEEPAPLEDTENLPEVTMNDVLGFDVCRIEKEEIIAGQSMYHFYAEVDGEDICVAEQFGYEGLEAWSRDLDGDGVPELICNVTFGDGVQSVIVYRNNNGIIEEGTIRGSYYEEQFGWTHLWESGISSLPVEKYDPEQDVFTATDYYTSGAEDPVTVEFHDGLTPFAFSAFNHQP